MKTVIFDFGNVVAHFDHMITLRRLLPFTHLSAEEMFDRVYCRAFEDEIEKGRLTTVEFLSKVQKVWQVRCDLDFLRQAVADIFTPNREVCELIPRLRPTYRLLLGSNTNEIHASQFRAQFADVLSDFDALVLSFEVGHRKPSPAFYAQCQALAHAEPNEIVFVDDLPANVQAAVNQGWRGIVYRPGEGLAEKLRTLGFSV